MRWRDRLVRFRPGWAIAGLLLFIAETAEAQQPPPCGPRSVIVESLEDKHGESLVAVAVSERGHLIEIFATPAGETWTILATTVGGRSCMIDNGETWAFAKMAAEPMVWTLK